MKKILLPILGFSVIAISTPIIIMSCSSSSNANIIKFDDFTPTTEAIGTKIYSFASGANDEWKSKSKEDVYKELNLTDLAGSGTNQNFRDEGKFKSIINGLTFSASNSKSLAWTDIDTSAINNPNAKVSVTYSMIATTSTMMINWTLDKTSVVFTITGTQSASPSVPQN